MRKSTVIVGWKVERRGEGAFLVHSLCDMQSTRLGNANGEKAIENPNQTTIDKSKNKRQQRLRVKSPFLPIISIVIGTSVMGSGRERSCCKQLHVDRFTKWDGAQRWQETQQWKCFCGSWGSGGSD